jgi:chemotaxis protein methyltransferase CheR
MPAADATIALREREFAFSQEDFDALRALVKEVTGINLSEQKYQLVYSRLARRVRALRLTSFAAYRRHLADDDGRELKELCNAITTNLTAFFREAHHFDYLRAQLLEPLARSAERGRRLRIWSAGCSTGEEPYSLAMTLAETLPDLDRWNVRILATDLDSDVLAHARRGLYSAERVRALHPQRLGRFFAAQHGPEGPQYRAAPELAGLITFKQLNLMHPLPMHGPLDAIFCRNVVIYFDKPTQRDLFARIAGLQRPGDLLFLGHSENLYNVSESYALIGKTIYRRS